VKVAAKKSERKLKPFHDGNIESTNKKSTERDVGAAKPLKPKPVKTAATQATRDAKPTKDGTSASKHLPAKATDHEASHEGKPKVKAKPRPLKPEKSENDKCATKKPKAGDASAGPATKKTPKLPNTETGAKIAKKKPAPSHVDHEHSEKHGHTSTMAKVKDKIHKLTSHHAHDSHSDTLVDRSIAGHVDHGKPKEDGQAPAKAQPRKPKPLDKKHIGTTEPHLATGAVKPGSVAKKPKDPKVEAKPKVRKLKPSPDKLTDAATSHPTAGTAKDVASTKKIPKVKAKAAPKSLTTDSTGAYADHTPKVKAPKHTEDGAKGLARSVKSALAKKTGEDTLHPATAPGNPVKVPKTKAKVAQPHHPNPHDATTTHPNTHHPVVGKGIDLKHPHNEAGTKIAHVSHDHIKHSDSKHADTEPAAQSLAQSLLQSVQAGVQSLFHHDSSHQGHSESSGSKQEHAAGHAKQVGHVEHKHDVHETRGLGHVEVAKPVTQDHAGGHANQMKHTEHKTSTHGTKSLGHDELAKAVPHGSPAVVSILHTRSPVTCRITPR
jgi:hypothetical protein